MDNIGYAIFKKSSQIIIDSNGMFEALHLSNKVESVINNFVGLIEIGKKTLFFKRLSSKIGKKCPKDAFLIILVERVHNSGRTFVFGSAICFKEFQVSETKIIKGVDYLLSQLRLNLDTNFDIEDKDLGVILPSTNKDFKIFKNQKLEYNSKNTNTIGFDKISDIDNTSIAYLHNFCNTNLLHNIDMLVLTSSKSLLNDLSTKGFKKIDSQSLSKTIGANKQQTIGLNLEISKLRDQLNTSFQQKEKLQKNRSLFRTLSLILGCMALIFGLLFIKKHQDIFSDTNNASNLYPVKDTLYISHSGYNVNIRSSPVYDSGDNNIKTVLSDGDKIFVLGFDKETLWAKIRYNEGKEIGYVSNRLISKKIATDRIEPIYKNAYIKYTIDGVPVYSSPKEIGKQRPKIMSYLYENDKLFIKNRDLILNTYSVSFNKNNEVYHGYVESEYINY